jgi:hypothetical protein
MEISNDGAPALSSAIPVGQVPGRPRASTVCKGSVSSGQGTGRRIGRQLDSSLQQMQCHSGGTQAASAATTPAGSSCSGQCPIPSPSTVIFASDRRAAGIT